MTPDEVWALRQKTAHYARYTRRLADWYTLGGQALAVAITFGSSATVVVLVANWPVVGTVFAVLVALLGAIQSTVAFTDSARNLLSVLDKLLAVEMDLEHLWVEYGQYDWTAPIDPEPIRVRFRDAESAMCRFPQWKWLSMRAWDRMLIELDVPDPRAAG